MRIYPLCNQRHKSFQRILCNGYSGTGCTLDFEEVWSSTNCTQGFESAFGSSQELTSGSCSEETRLLSARCCADVFDSGVSSAPTVTLSPTLAPPAMLTESTLSCSDLGWGNAASFGNETVCGASNTAPLSGCSGLISISDAVGFCEGAGARLCSAAEMSADEARETGCTLDEQQVWTSTKCDEGYELVYGASNFGGGLTTCGDSHGLHFARCCADTVVTTPQGILALPSASPTASPVPSPTPVPSHEPTTSFVSSEVQVSALTCEELGWDNAAAFGSSLVCAESHIVVSTQCEGLRSWSQANDLCLNNGARLCSIEEIEADETRGTGCGLDNDELWSSTPCGSDGFYLGFGSSGATTGDSPTCSPLLDAAGVNTRNFFRCCADVGVPTATPAPSPTTAPVFLSTATPVTPPTLAPAEFPVASPVASPTAATSTGSPSFQPTIDPAASIVTAVPVPVPTHVPIPRPTSIPSATTTAVPVPVPTRVPIPQPTSVPSTTTNVLIVSPSPTPFSGPSFSYSYSFGSFLYSFNDNYVVDDALVDVDKQPTPQPTTDVENHDNHDHDDAGESSSTATTKSVSSNDISWWNEETRQVGAISVVAFIVLALLAGAIVVAQGRKRRLNSAAARAEGEPQPPEVEMVGTNNSELAGPDQA